MTTRHDSESWKILRRFLQSPLVAVAAAVCLATLAVAAAGPWLAPQNPYDLAQLDLFDSGLPPGSIGYTGHFYLLGTDDQGRDLFSAIIYGLRTSLVVAFIGTGIAASVGITLGLWCGYSGGIPDMLISRLIDIQLSFPAILIALVLVGLFGGGVENVIIAIATVQWAYFARTARSTAMGERRKPYVEACHSLHYNAPRIVLVHIFPNCLAPLSVLLVVEMAAAIALEATLSFMGVGLPITRPSLGLLISNGYGYLLAGKYWISFYPGVVLAVVLAAMNLVSERTRQIFNPDEVT